MKNELSLLIEALEKKAVVLDKILKKSELQYGLAVAESFDAEAFDRLVDEKSELLEQMNLIDQGFDSIFQKIKDELLENQGLYKKEIAQMQMLIRRTIDFGSHIFTTEQRTKDILSNVVAGNRKQLRQKKMTANSVADYYKANGARFTESYFYDTKK